uniref:Uncharacterized protein n=1 Tax=Rhizophagus irregularis (strain DAOM 181602 / DAOM 197198 / MUCL 43194) TaxID=747089 RepID=U9U3P1_RHIID
MFMHSELCIDHYLTHDIMQGLRSKLSHNIPESFKNLIILIKSQETLLQKIEYSKPKDIDLSGIINLEPPEMINFIKKKNLVKFINKNELTAMKKIDNGHFGSISTAIWKKADKLSDIYSSGVLMRKLSGGKPPFVDNENGLREEPVPDTPEEGSRLTHRQTFH